MSNGARVAVVTGGNRGIGLEIGRQLAKHGLTVVLGSRDEEAGRQAATSIDAWGLRPDKPGYAPKPPGGAALHVSARRLDVTRDEDVQALAAWIRDTHGGLDVLVNNAAVALDGFEARVARETIAVNVTGVERVTDGLTPLLRRGGRVVNVTSGLGDTGSLPASLRDRLKSDTLGRDELSALMQGFVDAVAAGKHAALGWPSSAYSVSKMGLNALTRILGRELAQDPRGILVNAACPGWVRTRMGGAGAPRSVEEGADTPVWLALLPEGGPQGGVFRDRRPASW